MGKALRRLTTVLVILGFVLPVSGLEPVKDSTTATIKIGSTTATVDGKSVRLRSTIDIKDGKTYIYSADLGNIMGIRFPWSSGNKMATGYDPLTDTTLIFYADSTKAGIDGDDFVSTAKPYIKKTKKDSFFMVPLRYTCDVFGWSISVDSNKNIVIKKPLVLPKGSWVVPEGDMARTHCTSNGQAPKGQKLVEEWGFKKGHENSSNLYFNGKVLSNDITGWTCYDSTTKKQVWKKDCDETKPSDCLIYPGSQLAYCDGKVLYGVGPTAFDANTGETVWKLDETTDSGCVAFDGVLLTGKSKIHVDSKGYEVEDFDMYCYQVSNGKKLWMINLCRECRSSGFGSPRLAAGNGKFVLGWNVYETKTGRVVCEIPKEEFHFDSGGIIKTAYIESSDAFTIYNKEFIRLYDAKSGKLKIERKIGVNDNLAVKNDKIYFYNVNNSKLTCLDANNLDTIWENDVDQNSIGRVAIAGYQLISANQWFICGYGLGTGKLLWKVDAPKTTSGNKYFDLAIADGFIYITTWMSFQKFTYRLAIAP